MAKNKIEFLVEDAIRGNVTDPDNVKGMKETKSYTDELNELLSLDKIDSYQYLRLFVLALILNRLEDVESRRSGISKWMVPPPPDMTGKFLSLAVVCLVNAIDFAVSNGKKERPANISYILLFMSLGARNEIESYVEDDKERDNALATVDCAEHIVAAAEHAVDDIDDTDGEVFSDGFVYHLIRASTKAFWANKNVRTSLRDLLKFVEEERGMVKCKQE